MADSLVDAIQLEQYSDADFENLQLVVVDCCESYEILQLFVVHAKIEARDCPSQDELTLVTEVLPEEDHLLGTSHLRSSFYVLVRGDLKAQCHPTCNRSSGTHHPLMVPLTWWKAFQ